MNVQHLISPEVLRQYMRAHGYTIRSLAAEVGVPHSLIGHLLTGIRKSTQDDTASRIADALGVPVEVFFVEASNVARNGKRSAA